MINLRTAAAVTAAALGLALGALATPASAATQNTAQGGHATLHGVGATDDGTTLEASSVSGALTNQSVSPDFSPCNFTAFGYTGQYICGTGWLSEDGLHGPEDFVIGLDWSIWHAWPGSNGWHSLGGQALHSTNNVVDVWSDDPFAIWTYGTDGRQWCDNWGTPTWLGWHLCS